MDLSLKIGQDPSWVPWALTLVSGLFGNLLGAWVSWSAVQRAQRRIEATRERERDAKLQNKLLARTFQISQAVDEEDKRHAIDAMRRFLDQNPSVVLSDPASSYVYGKLMGTRSVTNEYWAKDFD